MYFKAPRLASFPSAAHPPTNLLGVPPAVSPAANSPGMVVMRSMSTQYPLGVWPPTM